MPKIQSKFKRAKIKKTTTETNSEETITMRGVVIKSLPNAHFEVKLENGHILKEAYIAGRMRKHYIHIARGDSVKVAINRYDLSRGRIIFRGHEQNP
jgi:translation initiation factor IF-1